MTVRIRDLCEDLTTLAPTMSLGAALQVFASKPDLIAIPVVYESAPLGLLVRSVLMEICASGINSANFLKHPVSRIMDRSPEFAEVTAPAAYIAKQITDKNSGALTVGIIATDSGRYAGYVPSRELLIAVSRENAARARVMKINAEKLEKARQDSIAKRREQAKFMAFVGHEIRTPLTGILGIADLLGDRKLDPEARDYARTISESGQHLDRLLGDFLDLSRMETGKLEIAPTSFKLSDFVKEVRTLWMGRSSKKGIGLKITLDDTAGDRIEGDATRLRQILFNLIGNAMKFTESGSVSVHVQTHLIGKSTLNLEMTVTDTGIGIAEEDKARLFEAFEQASPQTVHRYGGTGLGLSIAKGLVDQMGGQITLSDNPKGGTVFEVICPVRKAGPRLAVQNKPKLRKANFKLGRILLVEDHEVSSLVISEALKAAGWSVDCVETLVQGQRRAANIAYQAILSDLHLNAMSGIDLVQSIRNQAGPNQWAPVLAVTADVSEGRKKQCIQAGFSGFIEKPIRPRHLVAALVDAIIGHSSQSVQAANLKVV